MRSLRLSALLVLLPLLLAGCDGDPPPADGGALDGAVDPTLDGGPPPPPEYTLTGEVEVIRDSLGMVHIYAANDADLFYASGYMQAVDRLHSMDLVRRRALGRRAEILGPSYVDDDTIARTVDLARWGRAGEARMREEHPDEHVLFEAWTAGVNARIEEVRAGEAPLPHGFGPDELDYEPELWRTSDAFTVAKLILWGNANQLEFDLLATILRDFVPEAYARLPIGAPLADAFVLAEDERPGATMAGLEAAPRPEAPAGVTRPPSVREGRFDTLFDTVPSVTGRFASNNWAVDGTHTENGRPLIAGDPHQPLRSPSLFWMQHLNSADAGGRFDVAGFSFVGTPTVQLGFNRHIAWTATTTYPDISDLWSVRATRSSVRVGDEDVAIVSREETIRVAGADDVTITVEEVPGYGVLLPEGVTPVPVAGAGRRLLYNWVGFRATQEAHAFVALDLAEDLDAHDAAAEGMEIGCFNWIAASSEGITYRSAPLVPDRGPGAASRSPWTMLDGDDPATFWTGAYLDPALLPQSRGGTRGWLYSANNDPLGFTADADVTDDPFYFGVFYDPGTRAARIEAELARLADRGGITMADMEALQLDTHSVLADQLLPILEAAWAAVPTDEALAEFRDRPELERLVTLLVDEWDRRLDREASGAVAFDAFLFYATRIALADDMSLVFDTILEEEPIFMVKWAMFALRSSFPGADELLQQGRDRVLMQALSATAGWLEGRFGGVDPALYTWGDHHGTFFAPEYPGGPDGGWLPTDGGLGTVNKSPASFFEGGGVVERLESTSGPIYRLVAGFGEDGVPEVDVTVSRGNVGDPDSPLFDNTTEDWQEGRYRRVPFSRSAVDADVRERITLSP